MTTLLKTGDSYGICNRLFPFAHIIASAASNGFTVEHSAFGEFAEFFEGTCGMSVPTFPRRPSSRLLNTTLACHLRRQVQRFRKKAALCGCIVLDSEETFDLSASQNLAQLREHSCVQLIGLYFHCARGFTEHAELVRSYFRPVQSIRRMVDDLVFAARRDCDVLVGMHVRQGDYRQFASGQMFYTTEEYAELARELERLWPHRRVGFLICSNEGQDAAVFRGVGAHFASGHVVADLYSLGACDYIVGPGSSFSEWASFYGNVPRYVYRRKSCERSGFPFRAPSLDQFAIHQTGFGRCSPTHPASLTKPNESYPLPSEE